MWRGFKIPLCRNCKISKDSKKHGQCLCKNCEIVIFTKIKFELPLTNEETRFASFKDLSCILRSKRIFRQYLKFHVFSFLPTLLTRLAVRMQMYETLAEHWLKIGQMYQYIISISISKALLHIKTEVISKMCFAKKLFLFFLVNHEKLLEVLAQCLRNLFEAVHF